MTPVAHCERIIRRLGTDRPCGQRVALRSWYDSSGLVHRACSRHVAGRLFRYPAADPPEPEWLADPDAQHATHIQADPECRSCEQGWEQWNLAGAW